MDIAIVLSLLVVAGVLFSFERIPVDLVSLGVVVALIATRILTPEEALKGFGSDAVLVIGGLFVLTAGLRSSGALDVLSTEVQRLAGGSPSKAVLLLLLLVAAVSAFMNNTTCTAVFLPVAIALTRGSRVPPSRVLMPLAFASILGGTMTLIGTSTNVVVSGMLPEFGQAKLGMFELTPVGLPLAVIGVAYLFFFKDRLLPAHHEVQLEEQYHLGEYLTEVVVQPRSALVGKTVAEAELGKRWDLTLLAIERAGRQFSPETGDRFEEGDLLLVEGKLDSLLSLGAPAGLTIRRGPGEAIEEAGTRKMKFVEALVLPRSELVGRTLKELGFRQRFGASVVALNRHGESLVDKLGRIILRVGDVLLIHGEESLVARLPVESGLLVLSDRSGQERRPWLAGIAAAIFGLVVVLNTFDLIPLAGSVMLGCLLLFVTRCLTPQEAYDSIDWRILVLVAGMMGFAAALSKTGAAALLASVVVSALGGWGPLALIGAFYLLTVAFTQPMSNQAAALVVLPIAMQVAVEAGINPRAVAVSVTLAASSSFLTPLEPSCLLVYGPGRYRFLDFPRFGAGLTVIALLLTLLLVPYFWPLTP